VLVIVFRQSSRVSNNNKPSIRLPNYEIEEQTYGCESKREWIKYIGKMEKETGQRRKNLVNQCLESYV